MELKYIKCGDYYIPDIKLANPNICLGNGDGCERSICGWHILPCSPIWC